MWRLHLQVVDLQLIDGPLVTFPPPFFWNHSVFCIWRLPPLSLLLPEGKLLMGSELWPHFYCLCLAFTKIKSSHHSRKHATSTCLLSHLMNETSFLDFFTTFYSSDCNMFSLSAKAPYQVYLDSNQRIVICIQLWVTPPCQVFSGS